MQAYLLITLVFGCIGALEEVNLEKRYHGMNVITQCVVPGMVALTYDDGVSYKHIDIYHICDVFVGSIHRSC